MKEQTLRRKCSVAAEKNGVAGMHGKTEREALSRSPLRFAFVILAAYFFLLDFLAAFFVDFFAAFLVAI